MKNWIISFGPFRVIKSRRHLEREGETVPLGGRAFDILAHLLEYAGQVVSHRALIDAAWTGVTVEDGNLRFQMNVLRKALGGEEKYIVNVPGRGYCFAAPISRIDETTLSAAATRPISSTMRSMPRAAQLIGRNDDVARISNLISTHRIVTLVGPGGSGKTSVAVAAANQLSALFDDRICFLELGPVEGEGRVADSLAVALHLPVRGRDVMAEVLMALKSRVMLLIVDGCEHLIDAAAQLVDEIVKATTDVSVLVTSREPLRIESERVFQLEALASPPTDRELPAADILSYPAAQLLIERAYAKGIVLSDQDARLVGRICTRLDGLPLAIEIAAHQAQIDSFENLAQLLENGLSLTFPGRRTAPAKHQTLGAMIEWSYRLLPSNEQTAFRCLSVFSGRFSLEDANFLAGQFFHGTDAAVALSGLVSKSLVSVVRLDNAVQYRLLDTTKAFAREKLSEFGELQAVRYQHATLYLRALGGQLAGNSAADPKLGRDNIEDIRAAIDWAFANDVDLAVRLVAKALPVLEGLGLYRQQREYAAKALGLFSDVKSDSKLEMDLQIGFARAVGFTSGYGDAFKIAWSRVFELAEHLKQADRQLAALVNMLAHHVTRSNIPEAIEYAKLVRREDNARTSFWSGLADYLEGMMNSHIGNYAVARTYLFRSATESRQAALDVQVRDYGFDCRWPAMSLLALNCVFEGDLIQAASFAERALERAAIDDLDFPVVAAASNGSMISTLLGDLEKVESFAKILHRKVTERSLVHYYAVARAQLAAAPACRGSETAFEQLGEAAVELKALGFRGHAHVYAAEHLQIAIERTRQGLSAPSLAPLDIPDPVNGRWIPDTLRVNARLEAFQNRTSRAEALLLRALEIARNQSSPFWELRVANDLAELWAAADRAKEARSLLEAVIPKLVAGDGVKDILRARELLQRKSPR